MPLPTSASDDEERLMMDVFKGYNSLILPLRNDSQPIIVRMTLQLVLLINVDEKDQAWPTESINIKEMFR